MHTQWHWNMFFQQDIHPPFTLESAGPEKCRALLALPFSHGLEVIVTSFPMLAHHDWVCFLEELSKHSENSPHVGYWLLVGQFMQQYLGEVGQLLNCDIEHATICIHQHMLEKPEVERFAIAACLYHYARRSLKSRMILQFILQNCDPDVQQMQNMLVFYQRLSERQKEVAMLTAHGWTNQEIADELYIEQQVVAEHLTNIFGQFHTMVPHCSEKHGTRYRLIHSLTRLFVQHPYLLLKRSTY